MVTFRKTLIALSSMLVLSGCQIQPQGQGDLELCKRVYAEFSSSTQKAISLRRDAEVMDLYEDGIVNKSGTDHTHYLGFAQMNLDLLLERGCCRFAETCPAVITP